jgi:hypothetical protein
MTEFNVDAIIDRAADWAAAEARRGAGVGHALSADRRAVARAAGVERPGDIRVAEVQRVPFPETDPLLARLCRENGFLGPKTLGLTLDHTLFLTPDAAGDPEIFAHECCHVAQVERLGSVRRFLHVYIEQVLQYGYAFAPLEIEARQTGQDLASGDRP